MKLFLITFSPLFIISFIFELFFILLIDFKLFEFVFINEAAGDILAVWVIDTFFL